MQLHKKNVYKKASYQTSAYVELGSVIKTQDRYTFFQSAYGQSCQTSDTNNIQVESSYFSLQYYFSALVIPKQLIEKVPTVYK